MATWPPDHAPIGNRPDAPTVACRSRAVSDGQNPQAEPSTSGIVHRTHRHRSGWSMVMREERDGTGFGLRSPKDRRSADLHRACDQLIRDERNRGLRVEKPLAQGIEVDHRRNGDDRAAAAAEERQQDTRVERMFRDTTGQRVTRHGGGHRKEAERPET